MNAVSLETTVHAPQEAVFDAFTNLRSADKRISGIKELVVLTEGPIGVGTKFRETRTMFGRDATETMEITKFERPSCYVVEANSCGCHYQTEFAFQPVGDQTTVRCRFEGRPTSWLAKCMMFLMKPMQKKMTDMCRTAIQGDMDDLKRFAENG